MKLFSDEILLDVLADQTSFVEHLVCTQVNFFTSLGLATLQILNKPKIETCQGLYTSLISK